HVRQTNTGDLTQRGIRILGGLRLHRQADTALLRAILQNGRIRLAGNFLPTLADQLIDRRHGIEAPPEWFGFHGTALRAVPASIYTSATLEGNSVVTCGCRRRRS